MHAAAIVWAQSHAELLQGGKGSEPNFPQVTGQTDKRGVLSWFLSCFFRLPAGKRNTVCSE